MINVGKMIAGCVSELIENVASKSLFKADILYRSNSPEHHQVLDHFFAQVMVYSVDFLLFKQ